MNDCPRASRPTFRDTFPKLSLPPSLSLSASRGCRGDNVARRRTEIRVDRVERTEREEEPRPRTAPVRAGRAATNPMATITGMKAELRSSGRRGWLAGWLASGVTTNTYLPNIMIILELEPRTQTGGREGERRRRKGKKGRGMRRWILFLHR